MEEGCEVRFKNNQGKIDDCVCILLEKKGNFCRIKKPDGQILRIFNDRLFPVEELPAMTTEQAKEFDPWEGLPDNSEVWVKSNRFNETKVCETIAIIRPDSNEYQSINTYDGTAKKVMKYPLGDKEKLIKRMIRKGYVKQDKPN